MNDLTSRNLLADAPRANLFLEALAGIDKILPGNIDRAVEQLQHALAFALPEDRHACDVLVRDLTRMPFTMARRALAAYARAHPELAQQIACCTPDTDPRLHYNGIVPDAGVVGGLDVGTMPRQSLRYAYRPPRDTAPPQRHTYQRMHSPAAVSLRESDRAAVLVLRLLHARGVVKTRDLVSIVGRTVPGSHTSVKVSHIGVALRRLVSDKRLVYRPEGSAQLALTTWGQVAVRTLNNPAEPQIVSDYFERSLFRDWHAEFDRARRSGSTAWQDRLTAEVPIHHDWATIRATQQMIHALRVEAEAAATARDQGSACSSERKRYLSSLAPADEQAQFWDGVYLEYVNEQLDQEATYADKWTWKPRDTRMQEAARAAAQAYRRQNTALPAITRELVSEIASQFAEASADARPRAGEDTSTRRASIRTGIWTSADFRDAPEHRGTGIEVDYSKAAKAPVRGWRCVSCFIERSSIDRLRPDGRSDDGLCENCRADHRPGIPALPEGFTYADVVAAHCRFLATEYPAGARALLRDRWRRCEKNSPTARAIAAFMAEHPDLPGHRAGQTTTGARRPAAPRRPKRGVPVIGRGQRRDRCKGCYQDTVVDEGDYCTTCRVALGHIPSARPRRRRRAA